MIRRIVVVALVVSGLLLSSCGLLNSRDQGEYDSLEGEAAAQREAIASVLIDAFGEYETLGTSVNVGPCGELDARDWSIDTAVLVQPVSVTPEEGVEAMIDVLEGRDSEVEVLAPGVGTRPSYQADIGFYGPVWFRWASEPEPGIKVSIEGSCYNSDRVEAEDPWSLNVDEGSMVLLYE